MIHCLRSAASFLFLLSFHQIILHPHLFSSVVRFVLRYWQTNMFRRGSQNQRKSEGEEKGRKKEKKTRKRGIPISVNALVSLPLNFAVTVHALLPLPYCTNFLKLSTICSGVARTGKSLQSDRSRLVCGAYFLCRYSQC